MKKWDRYSLRGLIMMVMGMAGLAYETGISKEKTLFLIVMYSAVVLFGGFLLLLIKEYEE